MKLLYSVLKLDPESREGIIGATSALGIIVNLLIALTKVIIGALASSIAIISEGVNNAADVLTSVLTLLGAKLAGKAPDKKHPFGYGRIEYLTGLVIAVLILVTGVEMVINAVKLIIHPEPVSISYLSLFIVAGSAVIKFFLGVYTIKMGKKANSSALEGVGLDCRGDAFASLITIVSALLFILFKWNLDAYAGLITSAIIIKAGVEVLMSTVSELIGRPGEEEMAEHIYKTVRATDGVLNAADLMLHNYGPGAWSGSMNLELDHNMTVGEVYKFLHALQLKIMHEDHVTMVFGIYAVDNDSDQSHKIRKDIASFVRTKEHIVSYHAVYLEPGTNRIYVDLVVDYDMKERKATEEEFLEYMNGLYPQNEIVLTIETEYV